MFADPTKRLARAYSTLSTIVGELRRQNVTLLAGSFAYSAFVSLLPLLLLVFVLVTFLSGRALATFVIEYTSTYLTPGGSALVTDAITDDEGRIRASILGVAVLVWGTFKVFRGLDTAFEEIYGTEVEEPLPVRILDGLVAVFAVGAALAGMLGLNLLLDVAPGAAWLRAAKPALFFLGLTVVFLPLYYLFPDADVTVREVLPGAAVAAFGWMLLEALFRLYLATTGTYEAYGLIGAFLLLMLWLYFAGLIIMTGAVVNAVLAGRVESR